MMLDFAAARHLVARTHFGPLAADVTRFVGRRVEDAVDDLLAGLHTEPATSPPEWVDDSPPTPAERREMRDELRRRQRQRAQALKAWWCGELMATPSPLTERLVLLWHNHFTTSFQEVRAPSLLYRQNALFRRLVGGSFRDLLHEVARDPAMLLYLDTARSTRAHPNENFARELLELFTLGEGHYSEEDIREAARAFTGWTVNPWNGAFRFARRRHDSGTKTFLGRTGRFDGADIIDILLEEPQVARHVSARFWRAFVSPEPDPVELERIANAFREANYDLRVLLRAVLTSDVFFATENRGQRIKSPIELIAGTCRLFDIAPDDLTQLAQLSRRLGQNLFDPPNVKGWPGGTAWITSSTLVERQRVLRQVAESDELQAALRSGVAPWLGRPDLDEGAALERAQRLMLPIPPLSAAGATAGSEAVGQLLIDPAYQLT